MKAAVLIAAALALVGAAPAGPADTLWSDAIPPERLQGDSIVLVYYLAPADVQEVCGKFIKAPADKVLVACTLYDTKDRPFIVMPNPCLLAGVEVFARIQCHENAHSYHNWSATHER